MRAITYQKGLSLVELMISIALGLMLIAGALTMLLNSRELYRANDDLARIQENGRFAMDFLTQHIRVAGHLTGSEKGRVALESACGGLDPCSNEGAGRNSDRIALVMDPGNDTDCLGTAVAESDVIANVFTIEDADGDGINSLYCRGFNLGNNSWLSAGAPLVDGIEYMQILYGITDANNNINQYVPADEVGNWGGIGTVQVSLLVNNGFARGNGERQTRRFDFTPFEGDDIDDLTDRHDRQVYTTTIAVNNVIYSGQGL